jgi:hypothetical protein
MLSEVEVALKAHACLKGCVRDTMNKLGLTLLEMLCNLCAITLRAVRVIEAAQTFAPASAFKTHVLEVKGSCLVQDLIWLCALVS